MAAPSRASAAIQDALVAVIAEQGLEGTSVRRVAARAGVSIGAIQHHFPTKDAMLAAAMSRVEDVYRERLAEETESLADRPEELLRATLRSLVPRSEAERADTFLWLAFVARAAVHDATAAQHRQTWLRAEDGLASLIAACASDVGVSSDGEPSVWARDAAAELLGLADGVAIASSLEPDRMPPERARRLLDAAVDRVIGTGRTD